VTSEDLFSVAGKRVLVTGGSRGIGAMIAAGLVRNGADVIVSARKVADLERTAALLSRDGACRAVTADLSTEAGAGQLATAVAERFDRLDVLVNNAGATWGAPLADFPTPAWDKVFNTNVRAVFLLVTQLLPLLRAAASEENPARVINVGSIAGLRVPGWENYAYSASKAALHMLTQHLAYRLARERITVNAIAPGYFETRMSAFLFDDSDVRTDVERTVPLGRLGRPDDMAGVVRFLASHAGAYLTGSVVTVDGGLILAPSEDRPANLSDLTMRCSNHLTRSGDPDGGGNS